MFEFSESPLGSTPDETEYVGEGYPEALNDNSNDVLIAVRLLPPGLCPIHVGILLIVNVCSGVVVVPPVEPRADTLK